ncbi:hypothetical protein KOW79_011107 [Hemibagrus wyckioides]|uniref:Uncharacterized protein n=1 Tax=Hemibagrus wyckioides TaxID=337641 RepID=A0A9D3NJN9_9TELE|nr:hypothetical protein KOW79_011107 [Hemibagrus wyckioides]
METSIKTVSQPLKCPCRRPIREQDVKYLVVLWMKLRHTHYESNDLKEGFLQTRLHHQISADLENMSQPTMDHMML